MNPRILLVEDDPVSRAFLSAAAEGLPARVDAVESCAAALRGEHAEPFDLWLIDANLPDGSGASLLAALRESAGGTPALAHTASSDATQHRALRAAGFSDVLVKPLSVDALQIAIRGALGHAHAVADAAEPYPRLPSWDDAAALSALKGERAHVAALRRLFLDELPAQSGAIERALADGDVAAAASVLHRMRASCGFVGAAQLGEAVRRLEADPRSGPSLGRFRDAVDALVADSRGA
ncbi:MAG TPA: response regulator [Luteimonas sp.]|jgi:CheY-like chemotaxis protein/HPt (histidine-containing phosphotransfer) domain-containing protein|nr:response regulator [Luteimonas sp.]